MESIWKLSLLFLQVFNKFKISSDKKLKKKKNIGFVVRVVRHDKEENNPETLFTDG